MTPQAPAPAPAPAGTVVLLRPAGAVAEVLLIRRPGTMAFGPGLHVFPGGQVDPEDGLDASGDAGTGADDPMSADEAAERLGGNLAPGDAVAVHRAAVREVAEEIGVTVRTADLVPLAQWTTPTFMPRRFATWFFVADLPPDARPVFAPDEVTAHRWLTPTDALDARAGGDIDMWVPTSSVLQQLAAIGPARAADVAAAVHFGPVKPPRVASESGSIVRLRVGSAGGVPGRVGETVLLGRRDVIVLDPGDPSEASIDAILGIVERRGGRIRGIALSRADPDHAAGAEALAIPADVPVFVAPGAGRDLPYHVVEVRDREELPSDAHLLVRLGRLGSGRLEVVTPAATPPFSGA